MFEDRASAGYMLGKKLEKFAKNNVLVLGMARGGVVVAKVISIFLNKPLDAIIVKKISLPHNPELAIGAVAPKNTVFWNDNLVNNLQINLELSKSLWQSKEKERKEQEKVIRGDKPLEIFGKTVILVDDGVATGASVIAASLFFKKEKAKDTILAVPVIAKDTLRDINKYFDTIISLRIVKEFESVGQFYKYFPQVENEEVIKLLKN